MSNINKATRVRRELKARRDEFKQSLIETLTILQKYKFEFRYQGAVGTKNRLYELKFCNSAGRAMQIFRPYLLSNENGRDYVTIFVCKIEEPISSSECFSLRDFISDRLSSARSEISEYSARADKIAYWTQMQSIEQRKSDNLLAYLTTMNSLMGFHLDDILCGRTWESIPMDWLGYK